MTVNGGLNCSDQEIAEFKMLTCARKMSSSLQERDYSLFRETGGGTPWEAALKGKGAQKSWQQVFEDNLFKS